jgi:hypothetical protein
MFFKLEKKYLLAGVITCTFTLALLVLHLVEKLVFHYVRPSLKRASGTFQAEGDEATEPPHLFYTVIIRLPSRGTPAPAGLLLLRTSSSAPE